MPRTRLELSYVITESAVYMYLWTECHSNRKHSPHLRLPWAFACTCRKHLYAACTMQPRTHTRARTHICICVSCRIPCAFVTGYHALRVYLYGAYMAGAASSVSMSGLRDDAANFGSDHGFVLGGGGPGASKFPVPGSDERFVLESCMRASE